MKVDFLKQCFVFLDAEHKLWEADHHEAVQYDRHLYTGLHHSSVS